MSRGPGSGAAEPPPRIGILDTWRSLAVWMMLLYHALFDLADFGLLPAALPSAPWMGVLQAAGAGSFVLVSGCCVRLSRSPLRRGLRVLCGAAAVSLAAGAVGRPVRFGALHLLGCCMLLYGLARGRLEAALRPVAGPVLLLGFCAGSALLPRGGAPLRFLFPLGVTAPGFVSWDYYPLLPWGFLFFFGVWLGRFAVAQLPPRRFSPALTFCGRHSLVIYLLHQPLFYGALSAARFLSGPLPP